MLVQRVLKRTQVVADLLQESELAHAPSRFGVGMIAVEKDRDRVFKVCLLYTSDAADE